MSKSPNMFKYFFREQWHNQMQDIGFQCSLLLLKPKQKEYLQLILICSSQILSQTLHQQEPANYFGHQYTHCQLSETLFSTCATSFSGTHTHMLTGPIHSHFQGVCNFHSCRQISHWAVGVSLSCEKSMDISRLASNHQEKIRKWLLSTCHVWNFNRVTLIEVINVVNICQKADKT